MMRPHPLEVDTVMQRIRERGVPLAEFLGVKPYRGVLTGLNEAFLIDDSTRTALIRDDPGCAEIIKPYLRGQDIKRWGPDWQGLWMIFARRGVDIQAYPSVLQHLERYRERLEPKPTDWNKATHGDWSGRKPGSYAWYEIQDSVDYWRLFEAPKILYQEIQFHPQYAYADYPLYGNNKVFLLPTTDLYVLAVLNSPLLWWHNWRFLPHMKDEALSPAGFRMETLPIAEPIPAIRSEMEQQAAEALELTQQAQTASRELLGWLRVEFEIEKPGQKLTDYANLSADDFTAEVRKRRPKGSARLTPKALTELAGIHEQYAAPARSRRGQLQAVEKRIAGLVNQAYGLSAEEVELMWKTAPPRMPIGN